MKGAYIFKQDIILTNTSGVNKKVMAQINAFKHLGVDMHLFSVRNKSVYKNDTIIPGGAGIYKSILKNYRFYKILSKEIVNGEYKFIYIRYAYTTPIFIWFLKKIKCNCPNLQIIIEIPTFPYKGEMKGLKRGVIKEIEKIFIPLLKYYIDRIVTFYGQKEIYGIETIRIGNGIDTSKVNKLPKKTYKIEDRNEIRLVAIANLKFFHAYDRIIKGIARNQTIYLIKFNIIGDGPELINLKRIAKQLNVEHLVCFYGYLSHEESFSIVEMSDIAVGTLGMHRKGLYKDSSLKTREYCTMGIPFILSSVDPDFGLDFKYQLRIPADDSPLSIDDLVSFYEMIRNDDYRDYLQDYGVSNLDWTGKLKSVVRYINNNVN